MVGASVPDSQGKLSPEEKDVVVAWLNAHWSNNGCPFHGPTVWEVGDAIATSAFAGTGGGLPGSGFVLGGLTYPLIVVTCQICAFTVLVNAIKLGIVKMAPEPAPPSTPVEPTPTSEAG
jgi:hypothetical protein